MTYLKKKNSLPYFLWFFVRTVLSGKITVFVAVLLPNLFGMQARSIFWWGKSPTSVATPVSVERKDWKKVCWKLSKRFSSPTKLFGPWYFLVLDSSLCSFWTIFMCKENSGRFYFWFGAFLELALWPSLSLSSGFLGSFFSFQKHCLVLSEYRPGQS